MIRPPARLAACLLALLAPLTLTAAGAAHAGAPAGDPFAARGPVDGRFAFGMQAVPKFDERRGQGAWSGTRTRGLALHQALGVQVSREGLLWRHYEPEPGQHPQQADFDDAIARLAQAGIAVQAMVTETPRWASTATHPTSDPASYKAAPPRGLAEPAFADGSDEPAPGKAANPANPWAAFLAHAVRRYRGQVRYWQVWNEPDYPSGVQRADATDARRAWTGSLDAYVRMLQVAAVVIRAHDPAAKVVTGGLGHPAYLAAMLDRQAGRWLDAVDFHAYGGPGSDQALEAFVRVHAGMRDVLARQGLAAMPLLCSETGYSATEPEVQAAYAAKLYPTALALGVESTIWYANVNPSWRQMGLVDWRTLGRRTPGWWAYKNAAVALAGVARVEPLGAFGARGFRFTRADGRQVAVAWAPRRAADDPLPVLLPLGRGPYRLHDMLGRDLGPLGTPAVVKLTASPTWIDEDPRRAYAPIQPNPPVAQGGGLAIARAVADSANLQVGAADSAIDQDPDTQWACGQRGQPAVWLRLDLTAPARIRALTLKTGPTPAGTWLDVEASADGTRFRPVLTGARLTTWQVETLALPTPVQARAVRIAWHNPGRRSASFGVFEVGLQ